MDGIERELESSAAVIRLDTLSTVGRSVAGRYGASGLPTLLVFDGSGKVVHQESGPPAKARIVGIVEAIPGQKE